MRIFWVLGCVLMLLATGCAPAVIGGAAAGAYKAGSDERTLGRMVDDTTITFKVNSELSNDPKVRDYKVDVDTLAGVVTLTGLVENQESMTAAVAAARRVEGVSEVINNLEVGSRTMGETLDDKLLGSKIKGKLAMEPGIRSLNIDVDVYNGVVTLTGLVDSGEIKAKIVEIARTTTGTVRVVDYIKLKP